MSQQPVKLTAKGRATRQRIIEGAAAEVRTRGAVATTLDDVCRATATSKSQLFHYFPDGREQLMYAVAEHEADRVLLDQEPYLSDLTSWAAWDAWRDAVLARYREQGTTCPLGVLMTQLTKVTPASREVTTRLLEQWQQRITDGVRAMREQGATAPDLDPARVGAALLAGIQGGVSILLQTGRLTHLEAALDVGISGLRAGA
ncbi:transcriptional regulator, TetR family [Actinacidiphila yanglinensis]|uniref:Transcriptional regulator, TetR family n=1 Tax=Actinacidiphila yanglinensis TaxID=310779 RepID=A0A1H5ZJM3_9ACTN|nr:TetR/AcrR family transcriptional regulator [Actinacidiphila yanglinensis]SEG35965.1 transcriptional regulator, TetR family [Actinacidiphila yanglinensis]